MIGLKPKKNIKLNKILAISFFMLLAGMLVFSFTSENSLQVLASNSNSTFCNGTGEDQTSKLYVANTATVTTNTAKVDIIDSDCNETIIEFIADISVTIDDQKTTLTPGDFNTYIITITNNGPSTVNSLFIDNSLPSKLNDVVYSVSEGVFDPSTKQLTNIFLTTGKSITILATGNVELGAVTETLTATVSITFPDTFTDSIESNNQSSDTTSILAQADIALEKELVGKLISTLEATYRLKIVNNGPSSAENLKIIDTLPSQLTFISATSEGNWSCNVVAQILTCTTPDQLANKATEYIDIKVKVK